MIVVEKSKIINVFLNPTYDVYDDQTIAYIAMGVYGERNFHLVFVNALLGKVLVLLFSLFPGLNWHVVLYEVLMFIAITMLINMFEKKCTKKFHAFPIILIIYIFAASYYYYVQFSKCAGILPIAGLLYSVWLTEQEERKWYKYILPGALILLGTFYRFNVIYMIGFIFIPILIYVFFKANKKQKSFFFVYGALILVLAFGFKLGDLAVYRMDEGWAHYLDYNEKRAFLTDYGWPDYYNNTQKFEELGISIVDYENFLTWDFGDRDLFDLETLEALIEIKSGEETSGLLSRFFMAFIPGFLKYTFAGFLFLAIAYLMVHGDGKRKYIGICTIIMFLMVELILVYRGRYLLYRMDISATLALVVICFYLAATEKAYIYTKRSDWLFLAATCIMALVVSKDVVSDIMENRQMVENNSEINQLLRADDSNLYMVSTSSGGVCVTNIWEAVAEGDYANIFRLGGWLTESPIFHEQMEKEGIENLYSAMIREENVYCVDKTNYGYKLAYLRENYDANVDMILVKNIHGTLIWKAVTEDLQVDLNNYADGTQILEYDTSISIQEDEIQVEGTVYEPDTDSFKQKVYVVICDGVTGEQKAYYATQIVNEAIGDKTNGRYGAFYTQIDGGYTGEEQIYILLENENGYYYIECE